VKDENGDLLADSSNMVNRWKIDFSPLLNVHDVSDVRQTEIHTAEPLVPGPSYLEVEIAIAKFETYKSPESDKIPAELIQVGGETLLRSLNSLIFFRIRENCMHSGRSQLLYQFTRKAIKLTL
jgi:hypothetical protein